MRITKENLLKTRPDSNFSIRSHNSMKGNSQSLVHELCMFETRIKSVNTTLHDRIEEIFCLEALFGVLEDNKFIDPLFFFQAILDPNTMHYH